MTARKTQKSQTFSNTRRIWLTLFKNTEFTLYEADPNGSIDDDGTRMEGNEPGTPYYMTITRHAGQRQKFFLALTNWTLEELEAFRAFMNEAIDTAAVTVKLRDEEAKRRLEEEDDDSLSRLYRSVPQIFRKKRTGDQHRNFISQGSDWASRVDKPGTEPGSDA